MGAEEDVRAGRLAEALADLQGRVRKNPADPKARIFLFQLFAVMGQWERALTQLGVLGDMDASSIEMVQTYTTAIRCEQQRMQVFTGQQTPLFLGKPAEWMAHLLSAVKATHAGKFEEASTLRARAFEAAPTTAGRINDVAFDWIADGDSRLGPLLEAVVKGRYYWVPWSRLREIRIEKPVDLRDLVWTPAHLTLANGAETVAFIPTRYPGSELAQDSRVVMGRITEWVEKAGELFIGMGQRQFATNNGEYPLLEVGVIHLDAVADDSVGDGPSAQGSAVHADP